MSRTRHTENQFALDLGDDTPVNRAATESPEAMDNSQLLAHPDDTEALLGQWQQAGWIRPLDTGFARLIRELSEEQGERPQPLVLLLAALTSHQVGRGHVCIDLATLLDDAGQTLALPPEEPANTGLSESEVANLQGRYPQELLSRVQLTDCLAALQGSLAVSDGSVPAPLVLNGTRLYLRRFWRYEQRIA
ncbi:MAG TPA: exodeoxyribonuclease V subunit alpha, partial [Marinobacter hydrocarbonoclasticus]|nr:exodeoxyribonuclease V subunit alpha [Marinobacter nauticus]